MKLFSLVSETPLPDGALLMEFMERGDYTDCFAAQLKHDVSFPDYVGAFYTTWLFRLERWILKWLVSRPSTDDEASQLLRGEIQQFAAWREYKRTDNQLLMMDFRQKTCSWFMLAPETGGSLLYFGSAVMQNQKSESGKAIPWTFRVLLGLHRLYSRALLQAAAKRLR